MPASDQNRLGRLLMTSAIVLALGAILVRGIAPPRSGLQDARWRSGAHLEQPLQLLSAGAIHRRGELDERVSAELAGAWREARDLAFGLEGCPALRDWLEEQDGQRVELLVGQLRDGGPGDALAALTIVFQVARATKWTPGFPAHAEHAERLGGLLADWLARWGEAGVAEPGLHEAALVAALFYGRVMGVAWSAPAFGYNAASLDRARRFLLELTGAGAGGRTRFGQALQARYGRAFAALQADEEDAFFAAFAEECALLLPDLDGTCDD
ncbi:MAG: hypothetical protein E2O39_12685 [Planctomycetota bacterium]|nr:MAG: hypothetical protein E2O39_12685 [Planctomycetota bacterium]